MTTRVDDVTVEFLYLDREVCERCRMTEAAVEAALAAVRPVLALVGVGVVFDRVHVDSAATAERVDLAVSPTVRVGGRDVQPDFETTACDCGGDGRVPCRVWRHAGSTHERAPAGLVVDAVLRAAYRPDSETRPSGGREQGSTDTDAESHPVESYFGTESDDGGANGCC